MQIELLWIIPIVAFAFFIFMLLYFAQKNNPEQPYSDLAKEVNRFNNGIIEKNVVPEKKPDSRLNELEKSIIVLNDSLSQQQRVIDAFQQSNTVNQNEVKDLRQKLRDIYKEYDIVISENYSLKATVKKLKDHKSDDVPLAESPMTSEDNPAFAVNTTKGNLRLYEDTRQLNMNSLEDTSEIDLAQAAL